MAISRMQQPRQLYGLGSFVKKAVGKVTKPFTKVAKKLVPKEIAGIMRVAAPFLPAGYREAAYLLGTAKQTGRISPIDLALTLAPTLNQKFGKTDAGFFAEQFPRANAALFGAPEVTTRGGLDYSIPDVMRSPVQPDALTGSLPGFGQARTVSEASTGLFGTGGKMFQFGKGAGPAAFRDQTKLGALLLGDGDGGFSKAKIAGLGLGTLSLIQNSKTPEEAGTALAQSTGNSDDYDRGYQLFSQLTPELFEVPEQFRAANGGLMRTNYAIGSGDGTEPVNPFGPKPEGPVLPDEDKPFKPKPLKPIKMASGLGSYKDFIESTGDEELMDLYIEGLNSGDFTKLLDALKRKGYQGRDDIATGGRVGFALGTKPTPEESGLGGLPIEADMRYTGGFMPYGAVEKADDVPARLSKNEFVFTADAVRAAGGGSVNEGAKKMYQAMKQLEKKPEAKGMIA